MVKPHTWQRSIVASAVLVLVMGLIAACAGGDEGTAAQQSQAPGAPAKPAPAAAAVEPQPAAAPSLGQALTTALTGPGAPQAPSKVAAEAYALFPQDGMPQYGGQLRLPSGNPNTLNYLDNVPYTTAGSVIMVYDRLVVWDWKDSYASYRTPASGVAERWEVSPDGAAWTFRLRDNLRFHDGSPLTSADVKATYDHLLNPCCKATPPGESYTKPFIKAVEAPDPRTVVLQLKAPAGADVLLMNLAVHWTMIAPKKHLDQGLDFFTTHALGSGPFKWVEKDWERGVSFVVERNNDFREKGIPYLDSIKRFVIDDAAAQLAAFETRRIDEISDPSPDQLEGLIRKYGDKLNVVEQPGGSQSYIHYNTRIPPFDNPKVRQALYLWIDRQAFLDKVANGRAYLGDFIHYETFGEKFGTPYEELVKKNLAYRPDKAEARKRAKELLLEAGYTSEALKGITVRVVPQSPTGSNLRGNQILLAQLRELGLNGELVTLESLAAVQAFLKGDYGAGFYGGATAYPAPESMLYRYLAPTGQRNYTGIRPDPTFQKLLDDLARAFQPQERLRILAEMDQFLQQGTWSLHLMYWSKDDHVRWNFSKGRRHRGAFKEEAHSWLTADAPGRK